MISLTRTTTPCSVCALLVAFAIADDSPVKPAPQPLLLRLAVIDKSGSMGGEQLDVARNELLDLARQLPPSPEYPFLVIPFDTSARRVYRFTNLPAMEQFLSQLSAGGGTSIAPPPARLVLTDGRRVPPCFRAELPGSADCTGLPVVAALTGIADARAARGLTGSIRASGPVTVSTVNPVIPYRPAILPVGLHSQVKPSFFRDTLIDGTISIAPPSEAVAVVGSRQMVQVCVPAPFKRLLFYLVLAVCSVFAVFLIARLLAAQKCVRLENWLNEWDTVNPEETEPERRYRLYTLLRESPRLVCVPDAAFLLSIGPHRKVFYLEQDRATTGVRQIAARKTPGYAELATQDMHRRHFPEATVDSFTVLMIAPTARRRDALRKALNGKSGADLWKFAFEGDLTVASFLHEPVFFPCEGDPVPLVDSRSPATSCQNDDPQNKT